MVKTIGKYELHRTLGEGSFGKVKYAVNKETNEAVAIKVLDKDMLRKKNMSVQIKREISLMRMINHKHVISIKDVFATATKIFMVLELVEGGELFDKIVEQGKFTDHQARFYMKQIIDGMECCHNQGICHRDLKPENLLLDASGNLKISDFGMARLYIGDPDAAGEARAELLHTTCGTPNYVAPEVLTCQGYDGQKADVWSMGVILYVLLAGYLPFEESTTAALFKKIKTADFEYPVWFNESVRELLNGVLVVDPEHRISLQELKAHPWINANEGGNGFSDPPFKGIVHSGNNSVDKDDNDSGGEEDVSRSAADSLSPRPKTPNGSGGSPPPRASIVAANSDLTKQIPSPRSPSSKFFPPTADAPPPVPTVESSVPVVAVPTVIHVSSPIVPITPNGAKLPTVVEGEETEELSTNNSPRNTPTIITLFSPTVEGVIEDQPVAQRSEDNHRHETLVPTVITPNEFVPTVISVTGKKPSISIEIPDDQSPSRRNENAISENVHHQQSNGHDKQDAGIPHTNGHAVDKVKLENLHHEDFDKAKELREKLDRETKELERKEEQRKQDIEEEKAKIELKHSHNSPASPISKPKDTTAPSSTMAHVGDNKHHDHREDDEQSSPSKHHNPPPHDQEETESITESIASNSVMECLFDPFGFFYGKPAPSKHRKSSLM